MELFELVIDGHKFMLNFGSIEQDMNENHIIDNSKELVPTILCVTVN